MRDREQAFMMFLQIVAFCAIAAVIIVSAALAYKGYPIPAALVSSLVSAGIGKLFGEPLRSITLHQVGSLPPPLAAEVAKRAIASLPPEARAKLEPARVVLTGLTDPPPPRGYS